MKDNNLKDFFGTPALDFGFYPELKKKYSDNVFLYVSSGEPYMSAKGYILEVGELEDEPLIHEKALDYMKQMKSKGHLTCSASSVIGENLIVPKEENSIKDFFGSPAIDYGSKKDMENKYKDNVFIFVANDLPPFGINGFVLELGKLEDEDALYRKALSYKNKMWSKGYITCNCYTVLGINLFMERTQSFIGGFHLYSM